MSQCKVNNWVTDGVAIAIQITFVFAFLTVFFFVYVIAFYDVMEIYDLIEYRINKYYGGRMEDRLSENCWRQKFP